MDIEHFMHFILTILSDPKLALGVVAFCVTMLVLVLLLWVLRVIRRRREFGVSGQPAYPQPPKRQNGQQPIFTAALHGTAPAGLRSQRSLDELLAVEDSLKALRELYQRKLIPAEVYVKESQKYTGSL
jgi:hypothetical protein